MRGLAELAFNNIIQKRNTYFKVFLGFLFVFFITFCILIYSSALSKKYNGYFNGHADDNVISLTGALSDGDIAAISADDNVAGIYSFSDITIDLEYEYSITVDGRKIVMSMGFIIEISEDDGESIHGDPDGTYRFYRPEFCDVTVGGSLVHNYVLTFREEYNEPLFICGGDISGDGELLMSQEAADAFGFTDYGALIGKTVIFLNGDSLELTGTVAGIVNKNYRYLDDTAFVLDKSIDEQARFGEEAGALISLNDFRKGTLSTERIIDLFGEDNVWYYGESTVEDMSFLRGQQALCESFFSVFIVMTFIVSGLYIVSSQYFLIKKSMSYYGILKAQGISDKRIFLLYFFEMLLISLSALIIGAALAFATFLGFCAALTKIYYVGLSVEIGGLLACLGILFACAAVFSLIISLIIYKAILSRPPIYLLKGG